MATEAQAPSGRRRRMLRMLLASVLMLGLVLVLLVAASRWLRWVQGGPRYEGRPLMAWTPGLLLASATDRQRAEVAVRSLGTNAVPTLTGLVARRNSPLRQPLLNAQKLLPAPVWRALYRLLKPYESDHERQAAARALGILGPPVAAAAIPALSQAVRDPEARVAGEAAWALGQMGKPAVPALADALRDGNPVTRAYVCSALASLGPEAAEAAPALVEALLTADFQLQLQASHALARIGAPAVPPLLALLARDTPEARPIGAAALGRVVAGSNEALLAAIERLQGAAPATRRVVLDVLLAADLSSRRCALALCAALANALADSDSAVRQRAAEGLGELAGKTPFVTNALPQLRSRLQDENVAARQAAAEALRKIEGGGERER